MKYDNRKKQDRQGICEKRSLRRISLSDMVIDARNELLELCIRAGLKIMAALFEEDIKAICGPRYKHQKRRRASRWGRTKGEVVLGGRKLSIRRPRARYHDGDEITLPSYEHFQDEDPLANRVLEQILVGVSTRRYRRSLEGNDLGLEVSGVSRSSVSRRFIIRSWELITEWLSKPLANLDLLVLFIDGIEFSDHTVVCAIGVDSGGNKHALGLWEGSTENAAVGQLLLDNLTGRGLRTDQPILVVIDGSKALRKAVKKTFGDNAIIQRCQYHKRQNVKAHLPKGMQMAVDLTMRQAYQSNSPVEAWRILTNLIHRLEKEHPGAAASLREGLDETLTVIDLGLPRILRRSLQTTNTIESALSVVRDVSRNVKYWRNGKMVVRWVASGLIVAERRFRRITGYQTLPKLAEALRMRKEGLDQTEVA